MFASVYVHARAQSNHYELRGLFVQLLAQSTRIRNISRPRLHLRMLFLRGQVLAQFSEKLQNLATLICNVVDFEESKHLKRLAVLEGKFKTNGGEG